MSKEEKEVEDLRVEIEQKSEEIQALKRKVEALRAQTSKEKTQKSSDLNKMLGDVSEILDVGFNVLGISSNKQNIKADSQGLVGLIGDLAKLAEESKSYRKEINLGGKKGVVDFRVRTGPVKQSGKTSFAKPIRRVVRKKASVMPPVETIKEREPLVDVFDEEDGIKVTAELPGVEKNDINLVLTENLLTIKVNTPTKKYYKEVKLPTKVDKEIVESAYRNGILEIKLKKNV